MAATAIINVAVVCQWLKENSQEKSTRSKVVVVFVLFLANSRNFIWYFGKKKEREKKLRKLSFIVCLMFSAVNLQLFSVVSSLKFKYITYLNFVHDFKKIK